MKYEIIGSIVCYKNDRNTLSASINSFLASKLNVKLFLIDNSPEDSLRDISFDTRVEYIFNPSNPGFGTAHNIGFEKTLLLGSKYHLILNPDVYFDEGVLEELADYLDRNPKVGIVMPKILYPNNSLQRAAKLLPSPIDFLIRRFLPVKAIKNKIDIKYELHNYKYDIPLEVPFLSGCMMLFNTSVFNKIEGFDENIFMYTEDIDICRKVMQNGYKTMVYPNTSVYHDHRKKSFLKFRNLKIYTRSAIYYFNKWGWFFDETRKIINEKTLNQIKRI